MKQILIIHGHPDNNPARFGYALSNAYKESAQEVGHEVKQINLSDLEFPLLRSSEDFNQGLPPDTILKQQKLISWADHLVIFYPLWLGGMPALLKGFLEQVLRPDFAFGKGESMLPKPLLKDKSARVIITMGMPAFAYRWFFRAHSLKSLQRNILGFCGIHPVKTTLIGGVENPEGNKHQKWINEMRRLGIKGI